MSHRLSITLSKVQLRYVDQLVKGGLHGRNRADVARHLVMNGLYKAGEHGLIEFKHVRVRRRKP